eukprot:Phypoly_transcript_01635.p1 GENE.Phypoly_transcript_01635~~Phypoly_transcript_01635.p1  ORF type:complete len:864 (-),score=164.70 Phypoly_transcript_01635:111-2702(-)
MLKLIALFLVVVAVCAQPPTPTGSFTLDGTTTTTLPVGVWSDYIFVSASEQPQQTVTVNIVPLNESMRISKTQLTFDQLHNSASFQVMLTEVGDAFDNFTITFSNATEASAGQFTLIPDIDFEGVLRTIRLTKTLDTDAFPYIGEHSVPIEIEVNVPSTSALSVTLQSDSAFTFTPNPVVIPANTRSAWFTYTSTAYAVNYLNASATAGAEAGLYAPIVSYGTVGTYQFGVQQRPFFFPDPDTLELNPFVGAHSVANSNGIFVYTRQISNSTFTITPQAADTQFFPPQQTLGPNNMQAFFSFNTSSTESSKTVYFYASGGPFDFYQFDTTNGLVAKATITVPKRQIAYKVASEVFVTNTTYLTITLSAPVASSLTVTLSAGNVWFNTSSVTFTGNTTSIVVAVKGVYLGDDTITFALSGNDAQYYKNMDGVSVPITVIQGNFITQSSWYQPLLYVGRESDKIPIRASISPINTVTLTPYAANLIFNPSSLTFRNGTEQQYFTITPLYSNVYNGNGVATSYSTTINWFINGTDQAIFDPPASVNVNIMPRNIQMKWSAHLRTGDYDYPTNGAFQSTPTETTRYLHKTYKVWASINYIGDKEQVSVTPISPYYSFKPAVLFFDAKHTRIEYEATVTGVPPGNYASISYLIGGQDGGLYSPISDDGFGVDLRPLKIAAAVVAPDERIKKGIYLASYPLEQSKQDPQVAYNFNAPSVLGNSNNHVESFLIRSFVLPDKSLKITPRCNHVTFSPSSITIKPKDATKRIDYENYKLTTSQGADITYYFNLTGVYLEANFTAHAQAAGTHVVWFELSGDDADYYHRPPQIGMNFRLVMRPDSEPFRVSSSSFLFPSFVVVAAMAIFALAL